MNDLFERWLAEGIRHGFCSEPWCIRHDPTPFTPRERLAVEENFPLCIPATRLWGMERVL